MRGLLLVAMLTGSPLAGIGQYYYQLYYDPEHFAAVSENQAVRLGAEAILENQTGRIRDNLESINGNLAKLVLVREVVHRSLTEVDGLLRDGLQVKYAIRLLDDIIHEAALTLEEAREAPQYAVFASAAVAQVRLQALEIFSEVSGMLQKGGLEVLMDNAARDALLGEITLRLRMIRGSLYGIRSSIQWAKRRGFWTSLNPFRTWVNRDRQVIGRIIRDMDRFVNK